MNLKFIEVTNGPANWGKFAIGTHTPEEWSRRTVIDGQSTIGGRGWTPRHVWVLDLQTGEGAMFLPGGSAKQDLEKHAIWVCPMYEPMLAWLYGRVGDAKDVAAAIAALPDHVDLPDAPFAMSGHRRPGPRAIAPTPRLVLQAIDHGDDTCMMTWGGFLASCRVDAFTDDDGFGDLATETHVSNVSIYPSQAVRPDYPRPAWATQVTGARRTADIEVWGEFPLACAEHRRKRLGVASTLRGVRSIAKRHSTAIRFVLRGTADALDRANGFSMTWSMYVDLVTRDAPIEYEIVKEAP